MTNVTVTTSGTSGERNVALPGDARGRVTLAARLVTDAAPKASGRGERDHRGPSNAGSSAGGPATAPSIASKDRSGCNQAPSAPRPLAAGCAHA